ncbi:hypothetical protein CTI12_AA511920 [Artemisia annua]|uniref:Uncharacterized protein n=1 Tax=Artemisia annua TaxID=35608 RepID=A0A2U1LAN2_ARTAN|nr:hypothetical protein CTI12_AA511920 [Artemisia annua]
MKIFLIPFDDSQLLGKKRLRDDVYVTDIKSEIDGESIRWTRVKVSLEGAANKPPHVQAAAAQETERYPLTESGSETSLHEPF